MLGAACDETIAVGKAADGLELPFPVLDDGTDVRAPIAGVIAGLRAASFHWAVFLPVDVPLVTVDALDRLADACLDAAVNQRGPLPGAFSRGALPVLEARLDRGDLALRDAAEELDAREVYIDPWLLVNVNTREDLRAIRMWPGPERRSVGKRLLPTPLSRLLFAFVVAAVVYGVWRYVAG